MIITKYKFTENFYSRVSNKVPIEKNINGFFFYLRLKFGARILLTHARFISGKSGVTPPVGTLCFFVSFSPVVSLSLSSSVVKSFSKE